AGPGGIGWGRRSRLGVQWRKPRSKTPARLKGIVKQTSPCLLMVGFLFLPLLVRSEVRAQEKIRIGFSTHSPGFLPTVIAEKKGFYANYGLASEHILIVISFGINGLVTVDLDFSNGLSQSVMASIRGVPVKLVMLTQENLGFLSSRQAANSKSDGP